LVSVVEAVYDQTGRESRNSWSFSFVSRTVRFLVVGSLQAAQA
jgi:hypothetical protein